MYLHVFFHLLHFFQASVPYFEILEKWIYKGIISDPYSEVMTLTFVHVCTFVTLIHSEGVF